MRSPHAARFLGAAALSVVTSTALADPIDDALAGRLGSGTLTESRAALARIAEPAPEDDRAQLALGLVSTLLAGESLIQRLYQHGFGEPLRDSGMSLLPALGAMPYNAEPAETHAAFIPETAAQFRDRLLIADSILAKVDDPGVKLTLDVAALRLDLNADGRIDRDEQAGRLFRNVVMAGLPVPEGDTFVLALDRADAEWLRAYCNLLMAVCDVVTAHDWTHLHNTVGHILFPEARAAGYEFLRNPGPFEMGVGVDVSDLIALIHVLNLPVEHPALMGRAREHLLAAVTHSRAMWDHVLAETDDDREWLPGPAQRPAITGVEITESRIAVWREFLDDAQAILEGRRLVRFWRSDTLGLNLRQVFEAPGSFDLILWIQGSAAAPYLQEGDIVPEGFWQDMNDAFGGDLVNYFFYIN